MDSSETLCLRWNEFESNIKRGFSLLRNEEDFFDVTLGVGPNQIKAHRVILSSCSSFFRSVLKSIPHHNPFIYLRGIDFNHLKSVLCFMYNGEVRVKHDELDQFLFIAQELELYGLIPEQSSSNQVKAMESEIPPRTKSAIKRESSSPMPLGNKVRAREEEEVESEPESSFLKSPQMQTKRVLQTKEEDDVEILPSSSSSQYDHQDQYASTAFTEETETNNEGSEPQAENHDLLDAELLKYVSQRPAEGIFKCLKCSYQSANRSNVLKHVEARHFITDGFVCDKCSRVFKTRESRFKHYNRIHKNESVYFPTAK